MSRSPIRGPRCATTLEEARPGCQPRCKPITASTGPPTCGRCGAGRPEEPTAAIIDSRTLRSTLESGTRAGYGGTKRERESKVQMAVDMFGHLLALHVTPADVGDRAAVGRLAADIQDATGDSVSLTYVDQGCTGETAADAAAAEGIALHVVKLPEAKRGFALLPRRWVVERSFAWAELAKAPSV